MGKSIKVVYYAIIIALVIAYIFWITRNPSAASGFGLNISYILAAIAVVGTLISSVLFIVNNPKNAKKLIIGIVGMLVICGIAYAMSDGALGPDYEKYDVTTASKSKLIDMGMYLTVFLGVGAFVLAVVTESISLIKN